MSLLSDLVDATVIPIVLVLVCHCAHCVQLPVQRFGSGCPAVVLLAFATMLHHMFCSILFCSMHINTFLFPFSFFISCFQMLKYQGSEKGQNQLAPGKIKDD